MDGLDALLDGPRARGAFLLRVVMEPPWAVRIEDEAPLSLVVVTRGEACYRGDDGALVRLGTGDAALLRGPSPYTFADDPATPPEVRILPDQVCVDPGGTLVAQSLALGVRTWGNARDAAAPTATTMLIATWHGEAEVSRPLLDALPPMLLRRRGEWDPGLVDLLAGEAAREEPGQAAVLDRMVDLVLVDLVRGWATAGGVVPGLASADPVVGRALRLIHAAPDQPWTLATLAREVGVSRAAFARRFAEQVGEPAIGYLTHWRLAQAADLLLASDAGIESVARRVGYGSAFALSTAFKRHHGLSPAQYRRARRAEAAGGPA